MNAICNKETQFLKQDRIVLYESFLKPEVHMDDFPCHDALPYTFPPEASRVIQLQNKYWM